MGNRESAARHSQPVYAPRTVGYPAGRGCFGRKDRNKRTRCTGKGRNGRKPDSKTNVGTDCGNGNSAVVCSAICWAWHGSGASAALADSNYCALFDSNREKRYCGGCKINRQKNVVSDSSNAAGTRSMERCFCGISKLPKQGHLEYAAGGMAELPRGCRMDAALRNNGKWCLYAAGGPDFRPGEYNCISCLPQWRDQ